MSQPIIAIDGPAGVGKSTIAAMLAERLKLPFLNTGAMFRFLAYNLGEEGLYAVPETLMKKKFDFSLQGQGAHTFLLGNGKPIGEEVRTEAISALASRLAIRPEIRALLLDAQRELGKKYPLVAEGRDMGTTVFPDAAFKFFLDADPEERAKRRWLELAEKGDNISLRELTEKIKSRDHQDMTRVEAPLRAAHDAHIIDTTRLSVPEVLALILSRIEKTCADNPHLRESLWRI